MSEVKVNKVSPRTGTDVTVGGKFITESNADLDLYPNGTGHVEIGGNTNPGTIQLNCESNSHGIKLQSPAHSAGQSYTIKFPTGNITAGKFLKVDSVSGSGATGIGQLSFDDAGGITAADQWRLTADTNAGTDDVVSSNWERNDSTGFGYITGISESSGIFSFPSTGYYLLLLCPRFRLYQGDYMYCDIQVTTNNSAYTSVSRAESVNLTTNSEEGFPGNAEYIVDVTDTSNVKVRLLTGSVNSNSRLRGSTSLNLTSFTFIRLANT